MKLIKIEKCAECPNVSHTGSFTPGGAKPCCDHPETVKSKGNNCFKRVIPYVVEHEGGRTYRTPKKIPKFCPLEEMT